MQNYITIAGFDDSPGGKWVMLMNIAKLDFHNLALPIYLMVSSN